MSSNSKHILTQLLDVEVDYNILGLLNNEPASEFFVVDTGSATGETMVMVQMYNAEGSNRTVGTASSAEKAEKAVELLTNRMDNVNCIKDFMCPVCGATDDFRIVGTAMFNFTDSGADFDTYGGDIEHTQESYCQCVDCTFAGEVKDFNTLPTAPEATTES